MQLFPPIPILSPPTQTEATNNIKNIRNDQASILMNNIDLFVACLFLLDKGPIKALPQTKRKTKVSFSNSRNGHFLVCVCAFISWQICFRKLFAKPGKNVLPPSLKRTCRLVHVSHSCDNSDWWSFKICNPIQIWHWNDTFKLEFLLFYKTKYWNICVVFYLE